jgi:hypothetical protein
MDIGKAFGFMFHDDRWITKILIAAAILAVGILFSPLLLISLIVAALLLGGYGVEITRRVIKGDAEVLPEWENWGDLLIDGVKVWVIGLIYALPMILVGICLGIPISVGAEQSPDTSSLLSSFLGCFNFLWTIVMSLTLPAAIASFVAEDDLSAAFRFGDVFGLVRHNFTIYLITFVMAWVAGLIGGLGLLVCGVGLLVTYPYSTWVTSHLYGQAYLEATGSGAQPAAEAELA